MKLTLNTESLERLIGGDTQIEFEIRQQIADEFAKRHLKSLINTEAMKSIESELMANLTNIIRFDSQTNEYKVKIKELCTSFVASECRNFLDSSDVWQTMKNRVDEAANYIVSELQEAILTKRIDKLVDERIKERLGVK